MRMKKGSSQCSSIHAGYAKTISAMVSLFGHRHSSSYLLYNNDTLRESLFSVAAVVDVASFYGELLFD